MITPKKSLKKIWKVGWIAVRTLLVVREYNERISGQRDRSEKT